VSPCAASAPAAGGVHSRTSEAPPLSAAQATRSQLLACRHVPGPLTAPLGPALGRIGRGHCPRSKPRGALASRRAIWAGQPRGWPAVAVKVSQQAARRPALRKVPFRTSEKQNDGRSCDRARRWQWQAAAGRACPCPCATLARPARSALRCSHDTSPASGSAALRTAIAALRNATRGGSSWRWDARQECVAAIAVAGALAR
jgi:hypothetical protein